MTSFSKNDQPNERLSDYLWQVELGDQQCEVTVKFSISAQIMSYLFE
jgi:hypothetical protein